MWKRPFSPVAQGKPLSLFTKEKALFAFSGVFFKEACNLLGSVYWIFRLDWGPRGAEANLPSDGQSQGLYKFSTLEALQHRSLSPGLLLQPLPTISESKHFGLASGVWGVCQQCEGCFCVSAAALRVHLPRSESHDLSPPPGCSPPYLPACRSLCAWTDTGSNNLIYVFQIYHITRIPRPADILGA